MIYVKILQFNNNIIGFEVEGHAGYSEYGKDIVCSAVSAICESAVLGITKVIKLNCEFKKDDTKGKLKLILDKNVNQVDLKDAQIIFRTMKISLEDLLENYNKYIKMEEINYVY